MSPKHSYEPDVLISNSAAEKVKDHILRTHIAGQSKLNLHLLVKGRKMSLALYLRGKTSHPVLIFSLNSYPVRLDVVCLHSQFNLPQIYAQSVTNVSHTMHADHWSLKCRDMAPC